MSDSAYAIVRRKPNNFSHDVSTQKTITRGISQSGIRDRYRCDGLVYCDNRLIGKNGISQILRKFG